VPEKFNFKSNPEPISDSDRMFRFIGIGCGVLILIPVAFFIASLFLRNNEPSVNGSYVAVNHCESRVEELLKSPATAEFDSTANGSGSEWTVTGTVDSENGFGAQVRSDYQCTVSVTSDTATTTVDYLR
jgi:hypothetical protein